MLLIHLSSVDTGSSVASAVKIDDLPWQARARGRRSSRIASTLTAGTDTPEGMCFRIEADR
jgi:hypothetical protein